VIWKADVFACFEDQYLYFLEGTKENHENPWSEQPMLQSRWEQGSVAYVISRKCWFRISFCKHATAIMTVLTKPYFVFLTATHARKHSFWIAQSSGESACFPILFHPKMRDFSTYTDSWLQQQRFEVLTEVTVKITVLWNLMPCSLVERYQSFGRTCYFHLCSVDADSRFMRNILPFYQIVWRHI
jgi:hypothetical protein